MKKLVETIAILTMTASVSYAQGYFTQPGQMYSPQMSQISASDDPTTLKIKQRVKAGVGRFFTIVWNSNLPDAAISKPGGVIEVNPIAFFRLSRAAQDFVLMHESGHQMLRHDLGFFGQHSELQADEYAALKMRTKFGYDDDEIIGAARELFQNWGDATHPAGPIRVAQVRRALQR